MKDKFYEMAKNAILSDIETRDIQDFLDKIQSNKATEKALADFRKLSAFDKYKECVHYGDIKEVIDLDAVNGCLSLKNISIYGKNFLFILFSGEVINYYELR